MADFIIDKDPEIQTGVAATSEDVAALVADGTLSADKVEFLAVEQQPEDLKAAVLEAIAVQVSETDAVVADFTSVLKDIGATKAEANTAVADLAAEPVVELPAEEVL